MPTQIDLEYARRFRAEARRRFGEDIEEVRLFGSRARGDARPDSDLDLFVLLRSRDRAMRWELMGLAWDIADAMDLPYAPSPHVMSRERFDRLVTLQRRLARDILEEGVAV
ncbi:MAG: nucleotidyltransferase domain-containing protein [Armatimonadetes bacterium]|nr:nucleotidyltransferase domain-containing protein [Armatimonadota bacterium]